MDCPPSCCGYGHDFYYSQEGDSNQQKSIFFGHEDYECSYSRQQCGFRRGNSISHDGATEGGLSEEPGSHKRNSDCETWARAIVEYRSAYRQPTTLSFPVLYTIPVERGIGRKLLRSALIFFRSWTRNSSHTVSFRQGTAGIRCIGCTRLFYRVARRTPFIGGELGEFGSYCRKLAKQPKQPAPGRDTDTPLYPTICGTSIVLGAQVVVGCPICPVFRELPSTRSCMV